MRASTLAWFAIVSLSCVSGCQSCLHLDDYQLVEQAPTTTTKPTTTTPSGSGGAGGSSPCQQPASGTLFVSAPVKAGASQALPCEVAAATADGLDVLALNPVNGACQAHARIEVQASATIDASLRVFNSSGDHFHVAARYRGGDLSLPDDCEGSSVIVTTEPGAKDGLMLASLRRKGTSICTEWVRRAWTKDAAALMLHDLTTDSDDGRVAIAGSFEGASVELEDGTATTQAQGAAFWATYDIKGTLISVDTFGSTNQDAVRGVRFLSGGALLTGTLLKEDPACHGCEGTNNVMDAADDCPGGGGAGGSGGAAAGGEVALPIRRTRGFGRGSTVTTAAQICPPTA